MKTLRILCAEDDTAKYERTNLELSNIMEDTELQFVHAADYEAAVSKLSQEYFDVVILDLMLPSLTGPADIKNSRALVSFISEERGFNQPLVIGLTAVDKAYSQEASFFSDQLLMLDKYTTRDNHWAHRIAEKLLSLTVSREAFLNFFSKNKGVDLVVVAARYQTEFLPILEQMEWVGKVPEEESGLGGTRLVRGLALVGQHEMNVIVVSLGQMGLSSTASIVSILIERFRPQYLSMLGMCCGFRIPAASVQSKLLDVSIVKSSVCWDEGKYYDDKEQRGIEGFSYRANPANMRANDAQIAQRFVEEGCGDFPTRAKKFLKSPKVKSSLSAVEQFCSSTPKLSLGLNVSGNCIVSRKSLIEQIVDRNPTAQSLEMEVYSVMRAVNLADGYKPTVICIKGVADFGEEKESAVFDPVQPIASKVSYLAFDELMREFHRSTTED